LVRAGYEINAVSNNGKCALSEAVREHNIKLTEALLHFGAHIFHQERELVDHSPFF